MKKTRFIKEIEKENRKYEAAKLKSFVRTKLSFGEERMKREHSHRIFKNQFRISEGANALPDNYYFKPTDILLYDIIPKQDLKLAKKGIIRLFKKCLTHKYLPVHGTEEDIEKIILRLDQTLHSGNSWYSVGLFDFSYNRNLDKYIEHFEINFRNFSSSYAVIEMEVSLSDEFCCEIVKFIKKEYKKPGMCVHKMWAWNNKKKSGAKVGYSVSGGTLDEYAKSQIIYEQIEYVKYLFINEIRRYFPLMVYARKKNIFGINIFETNLTPDLNLTPSIYGALGLDDTYGFYLDLDERLYISTITIRGKDDYSTDMMYVYNPDKIENYDGYGTIHNKKVYEFKRGHMRNLYKMVVLKNLGILYQDLVSQYRNEVNIITSKRSSQKKLLQIKYEMSKDFYDFNKITDELPFDKTVYNAQRELEKNKFVTASVHYGSHPYENFIESPKRMWRQIQINYTEIENDLKRKIEISSELTAYSREKSNRKLIVAQLVIAIVTLVIMIFLDTTNKIAELIKSLWIFL